MPPCLGLPVHRARDLALDLEALERHGGAELRLGELDLPARDLLVRQEVDAVREPQVDLDRALVVALVGTRTVMHREPARRGFARVDRDVGRRGDGQGEDGRGGAGGDGGSLHHGSLLCSGWSAEAEGPGLGLDVAVGVEPLGRGGVAAGLEAGQSSARTARCLETTRPEPRLTFVPERLTERFPSAMRALKAMRTETGRGRPCSPAWASTD